MRSQILETIPLQLHMPGCTLESLSERLRRFFNLATGTPSSGHCLSDTGHVPFSLWKSDCVFTQAYEAGGHRFWFAAFEKARGKGWREYKLAPFWAEATESAGHSLRCWMGVLPGSLAKVRVSTEFGNGLHWNGAAVGSGGTRLDSVVSAERKLVLHGVKVVVRHILAGRLATEEARRERLSAVWPEWESAMDIHCREALLGDRAGLIKLRKNLVESPWDGGCLSASLLPELAKQYSNQLDLNLESNQKKKEPLHRELETAPTCRVTLRMATPIVVPSPPPSRAARKIQCLNTRPFHGSCTGNLCLERSGGFLPLARNAGRETRGPGDARR